MDVDNDASDDSFSLESFEDPVMQKYNQTDYSSTDQTALPKPDFPKTHRKTVPRISGPSESVLQKNDRKKTLGISLNHTNAIDQPTDSASMSGDLKQLLDRIRTKANIDVPLDDYGMICGDHSTTRSCKKLSGTAGVHMLKVKLRMQENEVDKMAKEAAISLQDSERATAQIDVLLRSIKNCKAYDLHQNQKLQACLKQISEIRTQNVQLDKEVDKLKREVVTMGKDEDKNRLTVAIPEASSTSRLMAINEGLKEVTQQVKDDNKKLQEGNRRLQQSLLDAKRKDQLECKRFMALVNKREVWLETTRKEKEHLEGVRSLHFTEKDLCKVFECPKSC